MRWLILLVLACVLVASGCGGSDDESAGTDAGVDCRVPADAAAAMYVGWSIWHELGLGEGSEDAEASEHAKVHDEIKADVETLARALV